MSSSRKEFKRHHYLPFFGADWLSDIELRACSPDIRAVWTDMLMMMLKSFPFGHMSRLSKRKMKESNLLLVQQVLTGHHDNEDSEWVTLSIGLKLYEQLMIVDNIEDQIARSTGNDPGLVREALEYLDNVNVFSRTDNGIIYSRRMARDFAARKRAFLNAHHGVNPYTPKPNVLLSTNKLQELPNQTTKQAPKQGAAKGAAPVTSTTTRSTKKPVLPGMAKKEDIINQPLTKPEDGQLDKVLLTSNELHGLVGPLVDTLVAPLVGSLVSSLVSPERAGSGETGMEKPEIQYSSPDSGITTFLSGNSLRRLPEETATTGDLPKGGETGEKQDKNKFSLKANNLQELPDQTPNQSTDQSTDQGAGFLVDQTLSNSNRNSKTVVRVSSPSVKNVSKEEKKEKEKKEKKKADDERSGAGEQTGQQIDVSLLAVYAKQLQRFKEQLLNDGAFLGGFRAAAGEFTVAQMEGWLNQFNLHLETRARNNGNDMDKDYTDYLAHFRNWWFKRDWSKEAGKTGAPVRERTPGKNLDHLRNLLGEYDT